MSVCTKEMVAGVGSIAEPNCGEEQGYMEMADHPFQGKYRQLEMNQ